MQKGSVRCKRGWFIAKGVVFSQKLQVHHKRGQFITKGVGLSQKGSVSRKRGRFLAIGVGSLQKGQVHHEKGRLIVKGVGSLQEETLLCNLLISHTLLQRSEVDAEDAAGNTAIHVAAEKCYSWSCWRLLEEGGLQLLHKANKDNLMPLDVAIKASATKYDNALSRVDTLYGCPKWMSRMQYRLFGLSFCKNLKN